MKIEILYPELCNLNGDMGNIRYLKKCVPEIEILETTIRRYFFSIYGNIN